MNKQDIQISRTNSADGRSNSHLANADNIMFFEKDDEMVAAFEAPQLAKH